MSNQLRGMVVESLNDLLDFFKIHQVSEMQPVLVFGAAKFMW